MTLTHHKANFENNSTKRLINAAKNKIGRITKVILEAVKHYKFEYNYSNGIIQQQSSNGLR